MKTLEAITAQFPTEDSCRAYIVELRWKDGITCPRCGSDKIHKLTRPWSWQCKQCSKQGYRFSPLVGTIFENTNYSLRSWFQVIALLCQSRRGISALQIHRTIGSGSYRTAWYMCHRIRAAGRNSEFARLTGMHRSESRREDAITTEEREELRLLRREVKILRHDREILKKNARGAPRNRE